jgi:crossover junction endonuclease MUS81
MTLRDQWARMLLCIKGLSAEKVATIIENYDTPNALWGAFKYAEFREAADIAKEQQGGDAAPKKRGKSTVRRANMLLTELEATGRKKIGEAMSQKIYELFMSYKY